MFSTSFLAPRTEDQANFSQSWSLAGNRTNVGQSQGRGDLTPLCGHTSPGRTGPRQEGLAVSWCAVDVAGTEWPRSPRGAIVLPTRQWA